MSLTYVRDEFLSKKNVLTAQILELLYQVIFNPLSNEDEFETNAFEIEKKHLLARVESELEDPLGMNSINNPLKFSFVPRS